MTKLEFIISSIFKFRRVNHTSRYQNSELNVFKNRNFVGELSDDLLGTNVYKTFEFFWSSLLTMLQWNNITSIISK